MYPALDTPNKIPKISVTVENKLKLPYSPGEINFAKIISKTKFTPCPKKEYKENKLPFIKFLFPLI